MHEGYHTDADLHFADRQGENGSNLDLFVTPPVRPTSHLRREEERCWSTTSINKLPKIRIINSILHKRLL